MQAVLIIIIPPLPSAAWAFSSRSLPSEALSRACPDIAPVTRDDAPSARVERQAPKRALHVNVDFQSAMQHQNVVGLPLAFPALPFEGHADAADRLRDTETEGEELVEIVVFYYECNDNQLRVHHRRDHDVNRDDTALFIITAQSRHFLGPEKEGG